MNINQQRRKYGIEWRLYWAITGQTMGNSPTLHSYFFFEYIITIQVQPFPEQLVRSCISLAQCTQPMMEEKRIWVSRDLLTLHI